MSVLIKAWEHFKTITRHRHGVIKNCYKAGILWQGLRHDLSKYSPEEFLKGCKYYQGTRSPHEAEREEYGFSYGWMHHKGRNKHHFEYWTDYDLRTKLMTPVKMPLKYVKEMFCDRVAASKIYMKDKYDDGAPLAYFLTVIYSSLNVFLISKIHLKHQTFWRSFLQRFVIKARTTLSLI